MNKSAKQRILLLMQTALVIVAKEGFQDKELEGTLTGLLEAGFEVTIASTEAGTCTGKLGGTVEAQIALRDVVVSRFERIAFIGGPGAHALAGNFDALNVARAAAKTGMPVGAICVAPTILAAAGVLDGKKATVWDKDGEQIALLQKHGATYTGEPVTVDGNIVTGNGPDAAEEFGKRFAAL